MSTITDGSYRLYYTQDKSKVIFSHLLSNNFLVFDIENSTMEQQILSSESPLFKDIDVRSFYFY